MQPKHQLNKEPGSDARFNAEIGGTNLNYTWYYQSTRNLSPNGAVVGQNTSTLHIHSIQMKDEGYYVCEISNPLGESVKTNPAHLTLSK